MRWGARGLGVFLGLRGLGAECARSAAFGAARGVTERGFGTLFFAGIGFGLGSGGASRGGLAFPWA